MEYLGSTYRSWPCLQHSFPKLIPALQGKRFECFWRILVYFFLNKCTNVHVKLLLAKLTYNITLNVWIIFCTLLHCLLSFYSVYYVHYFDLEEGAGFSSAEFCSARQLSFHRLVQWQKFVVAWRERKALYICDFFSHKDFSFLVIFLSETLILKM